MKTVIAEFERKLGALEAEGFTPNTGNQIELFLNVAFQRFHEDRGTFREFIEALGGETGAIDKMNAREYKAHMDNVLNRYWEALCEPASLVTLYS